MTDRILLFIPMYNCEKQISRVIKKITPDIQAKLSQILVIDNISKDEGVGKAIEALREVTHTQYLLLQNSENYSLGGSHKIAFNYCVEKNFDYCIVLHGDDQADIGDIKSILESRSYKNFSALLGARFRPDSILDGYSDLKRRGNIALNLLLSVVARRRIYDMGSGLNIYSREFLASKFYLGFPNDLTFNIYLLLYGIWQKVNFDFFPITWREFDQVSNAKVLKQGIKILEVALQYLLSPASLFSQLSMQKREFSLSSNVVFQSELVGQGHV